MRSCAAVIALLLFTRASSAQTPIRIADPDGSNPVDGTLPSVVATDEGFALGWWDWRSIGQPGSRYGDPRFAHFDASGRRIGPETRLVLGPELFTPPDIGEMERVQNGYVFEMQYDAFHAYTVPIDDSGQQTGESSVIVDSDELYPIDIASNGSTVVAAFSEWYGAWAPWSQALGPDGRPRDMKRSLELTQYGPGAVLGLIWNSAVARDGNRFFAAWYEYGVGFNLRELDARGVPDGAVVRLAPAGVCARDMAAASVAGRQIVFYAAGCSQTDVFLRIREGDGSIGPALQLTSAPEDEGTDPEAYVYHGVRAAAASDRVGLLWMRFEEARPFDIRRWTLTEIGPDGSRLGPDLDLTATFGMGTYTDPSIAWDEARGRWLVAWSGGGPEGDGVYVLPVTAP